MGRLPLAARVLGKLPTAVLVIDTDGTIAFANERATTVLETPPVGRHARDLLGPLDEVLHVGEDGRGQRRIPLPDGRSIEIGYSLASLCLDDGNEAWLVVFQDISHWASIRGERDRLLQVAAVGDLLPALLHELKNPLASVRSLVEVLLDESGENGIREELHAVLNEIRRLGLILDGVGRFHHDLRTQRPFAIDQACREAFTVLRPQASAKGIETVAEIRVLPLLPFDPSGFRAVVFNLVTNAIHACTGGDRIALRLGADGPDLVLRVSDTGPGMTPDVLARCRELFFTTKPRGSGIGLALCQSAVESAGGTMQIESPPGRGTDVTLRIPILPG